MTSANQFIKRAYTESEYTPELIQELVRCKKGPVYFIKNYVFLQHPVKGRLLFDLYDFQEELVQTIHKNKRVLGLISRQMGKCVQANTFINIIRKPSKLKLFLLRIIDKNEYERITTLFNIIL